MRDELQFRHTLRGHLMPLRTEGRHRHRKHRFDSAGLGAHHLCFDGNDLRVLVDTRLASDGPARVLRWRDAAQDTTSRVIDPDRLEAVVELPHRGEVDHPEGMALWRDSPGGLTGLMVVYDSPIPERRRKHPPQLLADEFTLPATG